MGDLIDMLELLSHKLDLCSSCYSVSGWRLKATSTVVLCCRPSGFCVHLQRSSTDSCRFCVPTIF